MDLQMPEMNGFEATDYIRNIMKSSIPIIALTADVTTVDLAKCKAVGMNDYIAKPVDERILYSKILSLVKKPEQSPALDSSQASQKENTKCTDLAYLTHRTKSNPVLMMEMIALYLDQTLPLIDSMKKSLRSKDWNSLYTAAHKIIPSFSIMGISVDFENMAKKVQDYANTQVKSDDIPDFMSQLERICVQACGELKEEYNSLKDKTA
jgi:CheY-like chemotaxis protein